MQAIENDKSVRKPTNLSLDSELLKEAKAFGINNSDAAIIAEGLRAISGRTPESRF